MVEEKGLFGLQRGRQQCVVPALMLGGCREVDLDFWIMAPWQSWLGILQERDAGAESSAKL